jgi:outer membrane lipoprotein SlyB
LSGSCVQSRFIKARQGHERKEAMNIPTPSTTRNNVLWAVVGALSVAVIGLGALLYTKSQPPAPQTAPSTGQAPMAATPASAAPAAAPTSQQAVKASVKPATSTTPTHTTAKTAAPANAPTTTTPAKAVCANCATVTAVTPIEREGEASGAGAVAGGVLGALVGQQFGQGSGKTATTVLGAVGGGYAGNEVEKRMKKVTVYQVHVRMDNGSTRTIEQSHPASVGDRVRVEGNALQPL